MIIHQSTSKGNNTKKQVKNPVFDRTICAFRFMQSRTISITKDQQDFVESRFLGLSDDTFSLKFFHWTNLRYHVCDRESGLPRIGRHLIAGLKGVSAKHLNTGKLLKKYKRDYVPGFMYRDYWYQGGQERLMVASGVEELYEKFLCANPRLEERVFLHTGRKVTERSMDDLCREMTALVKTLDFGNADRQMIADTLHNNKLGIYKVLIGNNFDDTFELARSEYKKAKRSGDINRIEAARQQLRLLHEIIDMPKPFYTPTDTYTEDDISTPRIYGRGIPYLARYLRFSLMRGCLELDLKNCQLDIVAALFKIESVQAFLRTGKSFWTEILEWLGLPKKAKKAIKKALYSLIYGMARHSVMHFLRKDLREQSIYRVEKTFLDHPLVQAVANAIEQAKRDIEAKGEMMTAYGWAQLGDHDIDSFLACCIQTYELKMIAACYKVFKAEQKSRHKRFDILVHQHDGISILVGDEHKVEVLATLKRAVRKAGAKYGMVAELECEDCGEQEQMQTYDFVSSYIRPMPSATEPHQERVEDVLLRVKSAHFLSELSEEAAPQADVTNIDNNSEETRIKHMYMINGIGKANPYEAYVFKSG